HVPVINQLPRLSPRSRKARSVHSVVQATFQQEQKVLASDAFHTRGPFEVISKLPFEDEINSFDLLLFAQLLAIPRQRFAAPHGIAVLSGGLCAPLFNRTRGFVATVALEEKFCAFAAAHAAHRISIPSQS